MQVIHAKTCGGDNYLTKNLQSSTTTKRDCATLQELQDLQQDAEIAHVAHLLFHLLLQCPALRMGAWPEGWA